VKLDDIPTVEEGDYGWCILDGMGAGPPRLVVYDDDDFWCSHSRDKEGSHECGDGESCYLDSGALVCAAGLDGPWETVPYGALHSIDAIVDPVADPSKGQIYVVAIVPDIDLCRLKVGFTERPMGQRLASYRTANPTAVLLGLWPAPRGAEQLAHSAAGGRIGRSEVFQVDDLAAALQRIGEAIRGYRR
jgi:hypothetical protein